MVIAVLDPLGREVPVRRKKTIFDQYFRQLSKKYVKMAKIQTVKGPLMTNSLDNWMPKIIVKCSPWVND